MIHQLNLISGLDKVETAIKRFKTFEPAEGYYLAFSGGKDSVVIKALADMAGVKYDAHYNVSSVDPPELVRFVKGQHADVAFDYPKDAQGRTITMWNLIPRRNMPPTRIARYCCQELKEAGGRGRFVVTGVRWDESVRRAKTRSGLELNFGKKNATMLADPDNPENETLARFCPAKGKHIINPIIDWTTDEVWEFIREYKVPYCSLYDEGFTRLGCIGCPMVGAKRQRRDFDYYPKYKELYMRAFERMLAENKRKRVMVNWHTAEQVFDWWINLE